MEQNPVVKRLYVGGLVHTVSETELQERFGKFGNVTETEIVTRKDEQGNIFLRCFSFTTALSSTPKTSLIIIV